MSFEFRVGRQVHGLKPVYLRDEIAFDVDGEVYRTGLEATGPGQYRLIFGDRSRSILMHRDGDRVFVHIDGFDFEVCRENRLQRLRSESRLSRQGGELTAPMPGVVVALRVTSGDHVNAGDPVIVIESMKLQTELCATRSGVVCELPFSEGDSFEKGTVLAKLDGLEKDAQV